MSVRIGAGLTTASDAALGGSEAARAARLALGGRAADLVFVFASGAHLAAPETMLEAVHDVLSPPQLIGCGAAGVLAGRQEIEDATALAVWALALDDGSVTSFHATGAESLPALDGASGAVLLPDPYTAPTDAMIGSWSAAGVPVVGGQASARTSDDTAALFLGDRVLESGAVGVRFEGIEILPCVSQGATPLGPELTITSAEGNVIYELAGRPALPKLREVFEHLAERERGLIGGGLLVGVVIDAGKPDYHQGDFLVRGLVGADPAAGSIVVGMDVHEGQVVRLHARDAGSAHRDLSEALELRRIALGGRRPAGALLFTCTGRGRNMFGVPNHDAELLSDALAETPTAGFFAAGEIGPVGGESFLHGFTATVAMFAA